MEAKDSGETPQLEQAAADTREPPASARVRAEDAAATRARLDRAEAGIREAGAALEDNAARLRETERALHEREREATRTGKLARDVAARTAELHADTKTTEQAVRETPPRADGS